MAQTGYTPILIYSSSTTTNVPAAGNLTNSTLGSELAINITDGKLFYKDNANAIQVIGWKTTPTTAGGTGLTSYTAGDLLYYASGTTLSKLAIGSSGAYMSSSGTAPQWTAPAALTKTDDTNVTLTLGGSASTALLNAASLTLGWTGTLAVSRGGTGTGTAFTAGSVVFAGASGVFSQNNSQLFWDNTNTRLGIGRSPNYKLDVGVTPASGGYDGINLDTTTGTSVIGLYRTGSAYSYGGVGANQGWIYNNYGSLAIMSDGGYVSVHTGSTPAERVRFFASGGVSIGNTTDPGATNLSVTGSARSTTQILFGQQSLTGSATINATTYLVTMYGLSGTATLTLPSAVVGQIIRIRTQSAQAVNSASNNITKLTDGSVTNSILSATAGKWADLWWDGSYWNIIAAN